VTGTYSFRGWTSRRTTVQVHLLLRSRFSEQRERPSGNPVDRAPAGSVAPQAQTHTAQNTVQGDAVTPLETGLRQRGDVQN
jgi:hypothetical protein